MNESSKVSAWSRAGVLLAFALFAFGGPFYRQVLHGEHVAFRNWVMFAGIGVGLADVEFFTVDGEGNRTPLDRFEVLGRDRATAPHNVRRMRYNTGVYQTARKLCRALGGRADLRADVRLAARSGWKQTYRGKTNLCRADKPSKWRLP